MCRWRRMERGVCWTWRRTRRPWSGSSCWPGRKGLDFHRPLTSSPALERAWAIVREAAPEYASDHYFAPDIARATDGVTAGRYRDFVPGLLPSAT